MLNLSAFGQGLPLLHIGVIADLQSEFGATAWVGEGETEVGVFDGS